MNKCLICNKELSNIIGGRRYCSKECRIKRDNHSRLHRQSVNKYQNSEHGRNKFKEYKKTDKYKESIRKGRNKWRKVHRIQYNEIQARRRKIMILLNIKHGFSYQEWLDKLNSTNGYCLICKKYVGIEHLELDHILPISKAPENYIYFIKDIQPLCRKCNASKSNKEIENG